MSSILTSDSIIPIKALIHLSFQYKVPDVFMFVKLFIYEHMNNEFPLLSVTRRPNCYLPAIPH